MSVAYLKPNNLVMICSVRLNNRHTYAHKIMLKTSDATVIFALRWHTLHNTSVFQAWSSFLQAAKSWNWGICGNIHLSGSWSGRSPTGTDLITHKSDWSPQGKWQLRLQTLNVAHTFVQGKRKSHIHPKTLTLFTITGIWP